jgi:hypothetical protein
MGREAVAPQNKIDHRCSIEPAKKIGKAQKMKQVRRRVECSKPMVQVSCGSSGSWVFEKVHCVKM